MSRWIILGVLVGVLAMGNGIVRAAGTKALGANQEERNASYHELFGDLFAQWDSNHDGKLDLKELNAAIMNPAVRGNNSAIAVALRGKLTRDKDNEAAGLSLQEVLTLSADPQMQRAVTGRARHIQGINHSLFLEADPNLAAFHQGGMGDCYLLAVIGAYVYRNPQAVRTMIKPQIDGSYGVQFANGKSVTVPPITDAELTMGASEGGDHGIWLSVLEKAFSELHKKNKEEKTGVTADEDGELITDLIGHAGYYAPVISLFTGHRTAGPPTRRWLKQGDSVAIENMDKLLTKLSSEKRVMAVCTGGDKTKKLPRGIPHGHVLAVLDYNPTTRMVRMFNPWGNRVVPADPPGLVNGYSTQHGIFEVPIGDFIKTFSALSYETELAAR